MLWLSPHRAWRAQPMANPLSQSIACLRPLPPPDAEQDAEQPVLRAIGNGYAVCYAFEQARDLVYVRNDDLRRAGLSPAELHSAGMANLFRLCCKHIKVRQYGPMYAVYLDGRFDASLFLLERLWQRDFAPLVGKGYAIAAPARDVLAFCDMESREGRAELAGVVARVTGGGDHLLSPTLFRIRKK